VHKCDQASLICDFSNPRAQGIDKRIKSDLLRHLTKAFSLPFLSASLNADALTAFHSMVAVNLFDRNFPYDDAVDLSWPHLSLVYAALQASLVIPRTAQVVNSTYLKALARNLTASDRRERNASAEVLQSFYRCFSVFHDHIHGAVYLLLIDKVCSNELLEFTASILKSICPEFAAQLFYEGVLRLLSSNRIYGKLTETIVKFINKDEMLLPGTLSYLLYHWPLTSSRKEVYFIGVCRDLMEVFMPGFTQEMAVAVFQAVGRCIPCPHAETAMAALEFVRAESAKVTRSFPNALHDVLAAMGEARRSHWDAEVREDAEYQMARLGRFARPEAAAPRDESEAAWREIAAIARSMDHSRRDSRPIRRY
jgi:hypothetical protein